MISARLRLGRMANGLSLQDLADILTDIGYPITRAGLSKYETGKVVPSDKMMHVIADITDLDESFFYKEGFPDYKIAPVRDYSESIRQPAEFDAYLQITLEQYMEIFSVLDCRRPVVLPDPITVSAGDEATVCRLAHQLRTLWGIPSHPIASVVSLLEDQGFFVFKLPPHFSIPCVAGVMEEYNQPFIGFARNELIDELRITLLRELAYFLLRSDDPTVFAHMTRVFARAFLLPEADLRADIGPDYDTPTFWELTFLKQKYGISKVEIRRCMRDLGILHEDPTARSLQKKNYISNRRKLDSSRDTLLFSENITGFRLKVLLAYKKKLISRSFAASLLPKQYIQMNSWDS